MAKQDRDDVTKMTNTQEAGSNPWLGTVIWPVVVLLVSLLFTSFLWRNTQNAVEKELDDDFEAQVTELTKRLEHHLGEYETLLQGLSAHFNSTDRISREGFRSYSEAIQKSKHYAGVTALAYHELVAAEKLEQFITSRKQNGFPDYQVTPAGQRTVYAPMVFIEPLTDANRKVLGFDPYTVPAERAALDRMRDSGNVEISAKLTLKQDEGTTTPGFVMYAPVYKRGASLASEAERRANFVGWVDSPFRMQSLMAHVLEDGIKNIDFEIFDGPTMTPETLLFDSDNSNARISGTIATRRQSLRQLKFGGQTWTLAYHAEPAFKADTAHNELRIIAVMGVALSVLLSGFIALAIHGQRRRAQASLRRVADTEAKVRDEERRQSEEELRESERNLNEAQRIARIGSYVTDIKTGVWQSSPGLDEIFGIDASFVRTIENWGKLMAPGYEEEMVDYYHRIVREQGRFDKDYKIFRPLDGEMRWVSAQGEFTFDADGNPLTLKGIIQDITDRKQIELELARHRENLEELVQEKTDYLQQAVEDLRISEEKYRIILDESSDPIFNFFPDGRYRYVNLAFAATLGKTQSEIIGKSLWDIFPTQEADFRFSVVQNVFSTGETRVIEVKVMGTDGERHLITTAKPIFDDEKRVISVICISKDITERKNAELAHEAAREAAERLARIKSDFLANMSHEIRTPLNGVLGLAQIGYRESIGRGRSQEVFARILESGKLLLSIINDILDFSKIEAGKLTVESVPVEPHRIVDEMVATLSERAREKGIKLIADKAPELPAVCLSDPMRISQILLNLLSNAVKFTEQGEVRLSADFADGYLKFCVSDTGIGMNAEQLERLFQPFEQADSSTTRKYGGTGLGLTICLRLAELMGGEIRVTSQPGVGSTFELSLPCCKSADGIEVLTTSPDMPRLALRLSGLKILAAEDNEINQFVLEDVLISEGARVTMVGNGRQALEAVKTSADSFDLVLMDVQMPEMDGLEATRLIHQISPNLKIVGQTAHALAEEHQKCRAAGMVDTITKPIDHDALVGIVLRHVRRPQAQASAESVTQVLADESTPPSAIDWPQLEQRFSSRPAFLGKLLDIALKTQSDGPARIRAAAAEHDIPQLILLAHTMKGIAGNLLAHDLMQQAKTAEEAARSNAPDSSSQAETLADMLQEMLDDIHRHPISGC